MLQYREMGKWLVSAEELGRLARLGQGDVVVRVRNGRGGGGYVVAGVD